MRKKIIIVDSEECSSRAEGDALCDSQEAAGFEYVAMLSNSPRPGSYLVKWGHEVALSAEQAHTDDMQLLAKIIEDREQQARDEFDEICRLEGRKIAAEAMALAAGYTGRDAEIFAAGYMGVPAAQQNPRAQGREPIFRAGRAVWGSNDGQRAYRIASVHARSSVPKVFAARLELGAGLLANNEF